jgi:hypothetical protein
MGSPLKPYLGHILIAAALVGSIGVVRAVYVDPRAREVNGLRAERGRLEASLSDYGRGVKDLDDWRRTHPGADAWRLPARRPLPARAMVAAFLRDVAPIEDRWKIRTERILPGDAPIQVTATDAAGATQTYGKVELRFHVTATYAGLEEYLRGVEAMDQLVVVRSVAFRHEPPTSPDLSAEVTIWLYGTLEGGEG